MVMNSVLNIGDTIKLADALQHCTALPGNTQNIYTVNIAFHSTTYTPMLHAGCTRVRANGPRQNNKRKGGLKAELTLDIMIPGNSTLRPV